jgi:sortase A
MGAVRRALHILSIALITGGVVILADVAMTLAWKEPLSTIYGSIQQGQAEDQLAELEDEFPSPADLRAISHARDTEERVDLLADLYADRVRAGEGIGRIRIARIGLETVIVDGTDTSTLRKGPGRYPETAFPGQGRTIGIAGHRTTYLAPFRRINQIEDGDEIELEMPYATFSYEVEKHEIVDPGAVQIVDDVGYERLVLTACHPLYSAAQRWAVFARLVDVSLFAPSERLWQDP